MTTIRVTPEFFEEILRRLDEPPREPNEKMRELLRKARGTIRHAPPKTAR